MKFLLLLVLSITTDAIKKSATVGKNFTYWCKYNQDISSLKTFFCKGEDPSICKPLINNRKTHINRLSTSDTKNKITITVREITLNDSGTYWCGAERPDNQTSNVFFGRLFLTVGDKMALFVYFSCCASVFATLLSSALRIYDLHALLAIKSAMDNFQSQRNKVVFPPPLERGAAPGLPPFLLVSSFLLPRPHRRKQRTWSSGALLLGCRW
uniref:Immunoglobulin V-set domain-containing protein n=1 Tax=Maylandia zebra TaxID=106582 RepID=A0A3P9BKA1_9CICH